MGALALNRKVDDFVCHGCFAQTCLVLSVLAVFGANMACGRFFAFTEGPGSEAEENKPARRQRWCATSHTHTHTRAHIACILELAGLQNYTQAGTTTMGPRCEQPEPVAWSAVSSESKRALHDGWPALNQPGICRRTLPQWNDSTLIIQTPGNLPGEGFRWFQPPTVELLSKPCPDRNYLQNLLRGGDTPSHR